MSAIDKVRVIVAGDSGCGKSSFTHLIANNETLSSPSWTVGCTVEVKLHEYKQGTSSQNTFFIELFDVGGSIHHKNTRGVFYYPGINGIILVHDLTNRKSQENLKNWLLEILNKDGKDTMKTNMTNDTEFDPESAMTQFRNSQIPILVIGTKADLIDDAQRKKSNKGFKNFADEISADEICLNCRDTRSIQAGTTDAVKLERFFDKVIERKYYSRENSAIYDKRKFITPFTSPLLESNNRNTPFTSPLGNYSAFTSPIYTSSASNSIVNNYQGQDQ